MSPGSVQSNSCFIVSVVRGQGASSELRRPCESHRQASFPDGRAFARGLWCSIPFLAVLAGSWQGSEYVNVAAASLASFEEPR